MMGLWLPDAHSLWFPAAWTALGFFQGGCPCCPADDFPTTTGCASCPSAPETWELTVSGVTDGATCTECDEDYNGTFLLKHHSTASGGPPIITSGSPLDAGCIWYTDELIGCGGSVPGRYVMWRYAPDNYWYLYAYATTLGTATKLYRLAVGSFDCLGPNTFNQFSSTGAHCSSWPTTMTVTPAA